MGQIENKNLSFDLFIKAFPEFDIVSLIGMYKSFMANELEFLKSVQSLVRERILDAVVKIEDYKF